jgi:hypothetical protein
MMMGNLLLALCARWFRVQLEERHIHLLDVIIAYTPRYPESLNCASLASILK